MGFLKNIATKGLGSVIGEDLADAIIPDDLGKRMARRAAKTAGEAAVDAAVGAAVGASVNALANRNKKNSLATPPPPPGVPHMEHSLRAMIAVNGQQYGPYEKAGLINMINNGSLTRETYVFIEGDSQWRSAKEVPAINALFGAPAMPAPPVPFATAPPVPGGSTVPKPTSDAGRDGLSVKMNSLIDAAVADGEISDLEREVLIRNAQSEGIAMDEFVIILEARLFEQRKRLQAEQESIANQRKHAEAAASHATRAAVPEKKKNEVRKCPACGSVILSATDERCRECGYELTSASVSAASNNSIDDLMKRLDEVDRAHESRGGNSVLRQSYNEMFNAQKCANKKVTIIGAYTLPTGRHDLVAFIRGCKSCADTAQFGDPTGKAWKNKFKEALDEYTRRFSDNPEAMSAVAKYLEKKKKFGLF